MYPKIEIKLENIVDNVKKIKKLCDDRGIILSVVTKVLVDNKEIVEEIVKNGVTHICDSRINNLKSYSDIDVEKWLIRIPMLSEIEDVVRYADASLNSEIEVIRRIQEESKKQGKIHKIILMYELGDLREGCFKEELKNIIEEVITFDNIEIYGIGVNLSCYGEVVPTDENMKEFVNVVTEIETQFNIKFKIISGGNSSSYNMLRDGKLPKKINNLRLGESVFLGNVPCFEEPIIELNRDNFILKAEIIELKQKPSIPWGKTAKTNSFGEEVTFIDRGIRKRAIVALGKQDIRIDGIFPIDDAIIILDGSSDHLILDVSDCSKDYIVGDIIEFKMNYAGLLTGFNSKYIKREII